MKKLLPLILLTLIGTVARAECVRSEPSVLINPGYQYLSHGSVGIVKVGISNRDSADCPSTTYNLSANDELSQLFVAFPQESVSTNPRSLTWVDLIVYVSADSVDGQHLVFVHADDSDNLPNHSRFSSAVIDVQ